MIKRYLLLFPPLTATSLVADNSSSKHVVPKGEFDKFGKGLAGSFGWKRVSLLDVVDAEANASASRFNPCQGCGPRCCFLAAYIMVVSLENRGREIIKQNIKKFAPSFRFFVIHTCFGGRAVRAEDTIYWYECQL